MKETELMHRIMLALSASGARLMRNNVGNGYLGELVTVLPNGDCVLRAWRRVQFGLTPGASDLIGWRSLTVGPEHVGRTFALFAACEVKRAVSGYSPARLTPAQRQFLNAVRAAGGLGCVAHTVDEARREILEAREILDSS